MVLVNQAIFEAEEGYTRKVKELKEKVAGKSLGVEESIAELDNRLNDLKFHKHQLHDSTEARLNMGAMCDSVSEESDSFLAEVIRMNAFQKNVEEHKGDPVSVFKDSMEYKGSLASRFVDGFDYLAEQAKVAYPQYDFEFKKIPHQGEILSRSSHQGEILSRSPWPSSKTRSYLGRLGLLIRARSYLGHPGLHPRRDLISGVLVL